MNSVEQKWIPERHNWATWFQRQRISEKTQINSLKVPTTASWASWSNVCCNGPATLFKTLKTQYGFFGKWKVSNDHSETDRIPYDKKSEFFVGRSSVSFYKQKRNRIHTALSLQRKNSVVATQSVVSERKEQNVAQHLSSKHKTAYWIWWRMIQQPFKKKVSGTWLWED